MKLRTLSALAMLVVGNCAMAQGSVTIYGRFDLGVEYIDYGATQWRLNSGTYTASRLGIRGTEDLGGGLSALFLLESGFFADTGMPQSTRFWNRGSYVGLSDRQWGTMTMGRQYVPIFWPFLFTDDAGPLRLHNYSGVQSIQRSSFMRVNETALTVPVANGSVGAGAKGIYTVGIASAFENNLVVYKTPSFSGLTFTGAVGAGENFADGSKVYGANVEYRSGPIYAGGGWTQKNGIVTGTSQSQSVNEYLIAGMYNVTDSFKVWGNFHPWNFDTGAGSGNVNGHDFMLGVSYLFPLSQLWANYAQKSIGDCTSCGSKGFGIGYHYLLSKRTELYASYGYVGNQANSAHGLDGVAPLTAGINVKGAVVGMAHQF